MIVANENAFHAKLGASSSMIRAIRPSMIWGKHALPAGQSIVVLVRPDAMPFKRRLPSTGLRPDKEVKTWMVSKMASRHKTLRTWRTHQALCALSWVPEVGGHPRNQPIPELRHQHESVSGQVERRPPAKEFIIEG